MANFSTSSRWASACSYELPDRARYEADGAGEDIVWNCRSHSGLDGGDLFCGWVPVSASYTVGNSASNQMYRPREYLNGPDWYYTDVFW